MLCISIGNGISLTVYHYQMSVTMKLASIDHTGPHLDSSSLELGVMQSVWGENYICCDKIFQIH